VNEGLWTLGSQKKTIWAFKFDANEMNEGKNPSECWKFDVCIEHGHVCDKTKATKRLEWPLGCLCLLKTSQMREETTM